MSSDCHCQSRTHLNVSLSGVPMFLLHRCLSGVFNRVQSFRAIQALHGKQRQLTFLELWWNCGYNNHTALSTIKTGNRFTRGSGIKVRSLESLWRSRDSDLSFNFKQYSTKKQVQCSVLFRLNLYKKARRLFGTQNFRQLYFIIDLNNYHYSIMSS